MNDQLIISLIKARKEIPPIIKDKQGQFKYASLEEILQIVVPVLLQHDLFFTQSIKQEDDSLYLITKIYHANGSSLESNAIVNHPTIFKVDKREPIKELGSNLTYIKRYSVAAMLGLVIEEEDPDGGNYSHNDKTITEKQISLITMKLKQKPHLENRILNQLEIDEISQIPMSKFNDILQWVDKQ